MHARFGHVPVWQHRFVADALLHRLVRWLRCAGVDCVRSPSSSLDELVEVAERENRVVLTIGKRGQDAAQARGVDVPCHFLTGKDVRAQFLEVAAHFGITLNEETFMSRCTKCNSQVRRVSAAHVSRFLQTREVGPHVDPPSLAC